MSTMSSFSEKLEAMEQQITGLTSRVETPTTVKQGARKSRSKEKAKRIEISDDEDRSSLFSPNRNIINSQDGTAFAKVFADTAVAVKTVPTPARFKKQRADFDLGVTPLFSEPAPVQPPVSKNVLPRVTSTVSKPPENSVTWENVSLLNIPNQGALNKNDVCDINQNNIKYTDQYGNLVQVQAPIQREPIVQNTPPVSEQVVVEPMAVQQQSMESLRSNPVIQQLVEERVALLETRMKNELQQGNVLRKKSGRYNTADTPCGPVHTRWPNESCPVGAGRKRPSFDDLSMGQFARGAFAASMHKVEDGTLVWSNSRQLADNRLTYSQSAVFSGSVTMSPRPGTPAQNNGGSTRRIVCKWFNEGSCPHTGDHTDVAGGTTFRHICMFCYRNLKRNNVHTELDCNNKKKPLE